MKKGRRRKRKSRQIDISTQQQQLQQKTSQNISILTKDKEIQTTINYQQNKQLITQKNNKQTTNVKSVRFEDNVKIDIYEQVDVVIEELGTHTSWIQVALDWNRLVHRIDSKLSSILLQSVRKNECG